MDVIGHDERTGARLAELIGGIPDDAWESATPCEGWSVRDLVTHVDAGNMKYRGVAVWIHLAETPGARVGPGDGDRPARCLPRPVAGPMTG